MNNPENPETKGTQDEDKQNKNTTQYVLDTTIFVDIVTDITTRNSERKDT